MRESEGCSRRAERASRYLREERPSCLLEESDGLLSSDRRKVLAELLESLAALEVIEKIPHRHPGAREDRLPAHDLRVRMDDLLELHH